MKKLLLLSLVTVSAGAFGAPITPFAFYGGYFRGNSFSDNSGNRIHISGLEAGVQQSLISLPLIGSANIGASVVFGGSLKESGSASGNLYRVYANYKSPTEGPMSIYGIAGFGVYVASGNGFRTQTSLGPEIGIGIPLKAPIPGAPGIAIEARYRFGSRAAQGFGIGASISF